MKINWLLVFVPVAIVLEHSWPQAHTWIFFAASLAIVPIASLIVEATEHIASRTFMLKTHAEFFPAQAFRKNTIMRARIGG